ncbi:MAG: hypothetical protein ACOCPW_02225 [Marinilabiliaceae bacterium]
MKLFYIILLCFIPLSVFSGEIELNGTYQGENIYVKNPYAESGVGFCVIEVQVNGMTTTDEINSNSFEIDLSVFRFAIGDPVHISIEYKEGCKPTIVNPEVITPRATFETVDIFVDDNNLIWETVDEAGSLPFIVEQYRWNKWIQMGQVEGEGTKDTNRYELPVRLHSGENRFRVRQKDPHNGRRLSPEVRIESDKSRVTLESQTVGDKLVFSAPTLYEIYDMHGRIVFKGYGETVNVEELEKGDYFLNFDNQMSQFKKR